MAQVSDRYDGRKERKPKEGGGALSGLSSRGGLVLAGLVVLGIILAFAIYRNYSVYSSFEVRNQISRADDSSVYYKVVKSGMIRYSKGGVALSNKSGIEIWNQTYDMSSPILADSEKYFAVGDRGANSIYVFDSNGQCGKTITDLPLQDIQISRQGVVAAVLSGPDGNYINMYNKTGDSLVSIKASLAKTGFPEAMALSPEGDRMAVTYLKVDKGTVQSNLVFYTFKDMEAEHEMYTETIEELCPRICFLGSSRTVVFTEKGFKIYSVSEEISKISETVFEDDIRSIFTNSQKLGFVFRNSDEKGAYRIEIYDMSGKQEKSMYFDMDYSNIYCSEEEIVIYSPSEALVYTFDGRLSFNTTFDNHIVGMMPSWDRGMYWIINDSVLREVSVK